MTHPRKILVIKHGAFGDLINATGAFEVIRRHHADDHITFLTAPSYETIAQKMGFFDGVWTDPRARGWMQRIQFSALLGRAHFDQVYDLQNSDRTNLYYQIMRLYGGLRWSGVAIGCSHPQAKQDRHGVHAHDRFARQLVRAGIPLNTQTLPPSVDWLSADVSRFCLVPSSVLIFPGSSNQGAHKRMPAPSFVRLAALLEEAGYSPVLMGGPDDGDVCRTIQELRAAASLPMLCNWQGKTSLIEVGVLAKNAACVIGNDTGPVQLCAAAGAKTVVVWPETSNPHIYGPRGEGVRICHGQELRNLDPQDVMVQFNLLMKE